MSIEELNSIITEALVLTVVILTSVAFFDVFMIPKFCSFFKLKHRSVEHCSGNTTNHALNRLEESSEGMEKRVANFREVTGLDPSTISRYADDLDEPPRENPSRPTPHWLDGARDHTVLPDIIASTYSDYQEESDYAMKQMLAILETLHPADDYLELFAKSLKAIEDRLPFPLIVDVGTGKPDWKAIRQKLTNDLMSTTEVEVDGLSSAQLSAVFDALPFLFDTVACYDELHKFQNALSMLVMMAMTGNSMIRRQCISAISILMERNLLSQEFMKDGVVPGLFFIYQSGVGVFQSNDLKMECVQALCQVISYDTIRDRRWLFDHFLPRFSQMLKDPTMHVRKSALQIFGNLGNMFGEKFTEVFLVPHLITLSCDMTWAVRKVACEIFVKVAECASSAVRVDILSPNFVRLLNDPNKWVSFIAYQQLGPFISLFADPEFTGIELQNGQIVVRDVTTKDTKAEVEEAGNSTTAVEKPNEFADLPANTWLPEIDYNDDFEFKLALNDPPPRPTTASTTETALVKTPKRGERVMDSVISGINKMFSPFERSSPKSSGGSKEIEKISATFSSPSKRSTLSLHSAVTLMDKWSKRNNPNNPQRFPVFDSSVQQNESSTTSSKPKVEEEGTGIAAKCNSTDDLTKLGLDDDAPADAGANEDAAAVDDSSESRTASPRGRRIAKNAWSKLDVRQKLFLRRLGALPPSSMGGGSRRSPKVLSPSPTRSPTRKNKKQRTLFEFAAPTEIRGLVIPPPSQPLPLVPEIIVEEHHQPNTAEQYMGNTTSNFNVYDENANSDDESEENSLDQSFAVPEEEEEAAEEDTPLTIEIKTSVSESVSVASGSINSQEPSEFSSLTYWSSNYAISSIDDELKPFGSSSSFTNSPTSNNYLESRFDVMKANSTSPRARSSSFAVNGSPMSVSPRRKANSTSESSPTNISANSSDSGPMLNTEEREKLGILDLDNLSMSMSSNDSTHGEPAMTEDSDVSMASVDHPTYPHVPHDLVESYMRVMGPIHSGSGGNVATGDASLCAEIYRHCAHNFPAVCFTLGRAAWPRLKVIFRKLALDEQARVRQSISFSIHEIANMLGTEITDEDLLPIFYDLRNDQNSDVRSGILLHLFDFVKCLSPEKRDEMIFSLPQFFPIGAQPGNQAQNGDWRSRFELISQLSKLCSLYSIQDVNLHMSGIALTLADDRVAEVRREAVVLVSTIVGALVEAEWDKIKKSRDIENGHLDVKNKKDKSQWFLSEQFVDDIVSSFAKTQKWTRRQTFSFICAQILREKECDGIQFRYFFSAPLQQLVHDKVPNVRLASCEALSMWRKTLITARAQEKRGQSPLSSPASEPSAIRRDINLVSDLMVRLSNDTDIDAAYSAKKCQGLTDDQQPVDVEARTSRMREREELFFGDVILTDQNGSLVRVAGKQVKQIIKHATTYVNDSVPPEEEVPEKEAPLQQMEEFEDETLGVPPLRIAPPPEVVAVAIGLLLDNQDNSEEVDMEIDEEPVVQPEDSDNREEVSISDKSPESKTDEEGDVPMDPTPSAPNQKTEESEA